jgi:hypothetical protein
LPTRRDIRTQIGIETTEPARYESITNGTTSRALITYFAT